MLVRFRLLFHEPEMLVRTCDRHRDDSRWSSPDEWFFRWEFLGVEQLELEAAASVTRFPASESSPSKGVVS